jgi:hypothetical protein
MSHLAFKDAGTSPSGKTNQWGVWSTDARDECLGSIRWYSHWRRYVFYPLGARLFDASCLSEIVAFLSTQTSEHHKRTSMVPIVGEEKE